MPSSLQPQPAGVFMQCHHGAGLWFAEDDDTEHGEWFLVRNLAGCEWSSQWVSAPERIDLLRRIARAFYGGFPRSADKLLLRDLLDTPITDAAGVERWIDSIANASVPLPAANHTGTIENGGHAGSHHYPAPVQEIEFFVRADWQLWVTDEQGHPLQVVQAQPDATDDGTVEVTYAHPASVHAAAHHAAHLAGKRYLLPAGHPATQQARGKRAHH